MRHKRLILFIIVFLLALSNANAQPAPIKVTVNTDFDTIDVNPGDGKCADANGKCSLRAAIMEANMAQPGSIIRLPAETFSIGIGGINEDNGATGDFDIKQVMTIIGGGATRTTINGADIDRVFHVHAKSFSLKNVKITGGNAKISSMPHGGGLYQPEGTLYMDGVLFEDNEAMYGGGIALSTFFLLTTAYISNSTFMNNAVTEYGGAIFISDYVSADSPEPTTTLNNVSIWGNSADDYGGGIFNGMNHLLVLNSTSVVNNVSNNYAGGIMLNGNGLAVRSILAGNTATTNWQDCYGYFRDGSIYNLITISANCNFNPGAVTVDNSANAYGDNFTAGQMPVVKIGESSPALNKGGLCEGSDQLGTPRLTGQLCDIGAFEYINASNHVDNGDFETALAANPKLPGDWKGAKLTSDGLVYNKPSLVPGTLDKVVSYSGNSAMRFVGQSGKNASLTQQLPNFENASPEDTVYVRYYASGSKLQANKGAVTVTIKYIDGTTHKIRVTAAPGTYDYRQFVKAERLKGIVLKASVSVSHAGSAGTLTVDDVSVRLTNIPVLRDQWIPLPPSN